MTVDPVKATIALGTSIGDIYAVPGSGVAVTVITGLSIKNMHSAALTPTICLIEPGQTAQSVARTIWNEPLDAGERVDVLDETPFFMAPGATMRGFCGTGALVSVRVSALQFAAQPAGLVLKVIEGVALTNALVTQYTCPGITQAILLASTFCNTDSAPHTPSLHIIASGGSASVSNEDWAQALLEKETAIPSGYEHLDAGDFIQAKAETGALVSLRLSVLEVT